MSVGTNHRRKNRTHREYTGSKQFAESCRNHGSCPWCSASRRYVILRRIVLDFDDKEDFA
jgi:hypothetical protein